MTIMPGSLLHDLRFAVRTLGRAKGFTLLAVLAGPRQRASVLRLGSDR
jgi:hypothetical protein